MPIHAYEIGDDVVPDDVSTVAEFADFEAGDPVRYGDGETSVGVVLEVMNESFPWPEAEGGDDEEMGTVDPEDAAEGGTVYIVSRGGGGSGLYDASELESVDPSVFRPDDADKDELMDGVADAELGSAYPDGVACPDGECGQLMDVEELSVNIKGVKDPHVGWADWPDSWEDSEKPARLIFLDMWSSVGAQFRTCKARLGGRVGGNINRFCAASKDEAWGTTAWRKFND